MSASVTSVSGTDQAPAPGEQQAWPSPARAYYTVFVVALVVMFAELDRGAMQLLIAPIKHDFHLSDSSIGLLMGVVFVTPYVLLSVPLAYFIDRNNRRNLLAAALAVWSLATCLCGVAQNFLQLCAARLFLGAGESVNGPAIFSIISDSFPKERLTRAISLMQLGVIGGAQVSAILGGLAIHYLMSTPDQHIANIGVIHWWQMVFIIVGLPGLAVALLTRLTLKEPVRRGALDTGNVSILKVLAYMRGHWKVFAPIMGSMALGGLGMGALTWSAAFYQRTYGWKPDKIGVITGSVGLPTALLGLFLGTMLYEHFVRKGYKDAAMRVVVLGRIIALPAMLAMPLMPTPELAIALASFAGLMVGVTGASQNAALQIISPNNMRGQVTALFFFFYSVIGQGLSPWLIGIINDLVFGENQIRYTLFTVALLFSPASLFVFWLGMKPYAREVARLEAVGAV